jgi:hypothetical protein
VSLPEGDEVGVPDARVASEAAAAALSYAMIGADGSKEIRDTIKANKAETLWRANSTDIIDSLRKPQKPLLTMEEAKGLDPLDIMRYMNQSNEFTADKKHRYEEYKKREAGETLSGADDDDNTAPTAVSFDPGVKDFDGPAKGGKVKGMMSKLRNRLGSPTRGQ